MALDPPPLVIDCARVLAYAFVQDLPYRRAFALYSGGKLVGQVPRLAIVENLGADRLVSLLHCDEHWEVLGSSGGEDDDAESARRHAERSYPGVAALWIDTGTTIEAALQHYDEVGDGQKCSFCGRRPFDMDYWTEGTEAIICSTCVAQFHQNFQKYMEEGGECPSDAT